MMWLGIGGLVATAIALGLRGWASTVLMIIGALLILACAISAVLS